MGTSRRKGTRRNSGGRRNPTPPPISGLPSVAQLDREMRVAEAAMSIANRFVGRWGM